MSESENLSPDRSPEMPPERPLDPQGPPIPPDDAPRMPVESESPCAAIWLATLVASGAGLLLIAGQTTQCAGATRSMRLQWETRQQMIEAAADAARPESERAVSDERGPN